MKKEIAPLLKKQIIAIVKEALAEDRAFNDITSNVLISPLIKAKFKIIFKERGVLCGIEFAKEAFLALDKKMIFKKIKNDGSLIQKGEVVAEIYGKARSILSAERTALNFLGHLSGIATLARKFAGLTSVSKIGITDTRKTLPLLRQSQKYAVRIGGGLSHRANLAEQFLVKNNHLAILAREEKNRPVIEFAIERIKNKNKGLKKIEIEVRSLKELKYALKLKPDIIMLDNMNVNNIKKALQLREKINPRIKIEVSGRMTPSKVKRLSSLDIDYISIGMLTHSVKIIDLSLKAA